MTLLVVGTSAGMKWLVYDGGDVGHHRPSVVSQRGVTGGMRGEPTGMTRRADVGRRSHGIVYVKVEFIRWEASKVKCLVSI